MKTLKQNTVHSCLSMCLNRFVYLGSVGFSFIGLHCRFSQHQVLGGGVELRKLGALQEKTVHQTDSTIIPPQNPAIFFNGRFMAA